MSDATTPPPDLGLFARAIGIVFAPAATFRSVVAAPRPFGILFLVCLVIALSTTLPQFTERGRRAMLDMQVQQVEKFTRQPVSPEMYAQMEAGAAWGPYWTLLGVFMAIPVVVLIFAALYWALFNATLGGTATFAQSLGVTAHSSVIGAVGALVSAPVQLMQDTMSPAGPFNLGALVPMLDPDSRLGALLAGLTFFGLWECVVVGIGLGVLYKRRSTGIVLTVLAIHLSLAALRTVGFSVLMGR